MTTPTPRALAATLAALALGAACQPGSQDIETLKENDRQILAKLEQLEQKVGQPARPAGPPPEDYNKVYPIEPGTSPVLGDPDAPVTLVEFSDFECPFCARAVPDLKQLQAKYPDKLKIIFKHFPLSFHPQARPTAIASMAAHEAGCFWEFHDKAFEATSQRSLSASAIDEYAKSAGCDLEKFKSALEKNASTYEARITEDMNLGQRADVRGTPTLYINGKKVMNRSIDGMSSMVEDALRAAKPG
jgi:protein-disulfide isomerase